LLEKKIVPHPNDFCMIVISMVLKYVPFLHLNGFDLFFTQHWGFNFHLIVNFFPIDLHINLKRESIKKIIFLGSI
jgi:hypothetical protein